ncbi:MAG: recombinase family protein, partial [Vicinamibacterales bacterium]
MIAAIYARKSTDQSDRDEADKSVARQVDHARAFALERGWTVDERHLYIDDGVSGADFETRPGLIRLLNSVKGGRPPFDVLIMANQSRLGRDTIRTGYALLQIVEAGVHVWFYLEGQQAKLDGPLDQMMQS